MENTKKSSLSWWIYLLNGVLMIVLGIWMLRMPKDSFSAMALIVGLIILGSGIIESVLSIYFRKVIWEWGWSLVAGIVDIIIGAFLITNPVAMLKIITFFIAFWLVVRGILFIRESINMRNMDHPRWTTILILGILFLILAVVILWHPQIVGLTLMIWLGISFISLGILRVILAFKIQSLSSKAE